MDSDWSNQHTMTEHKLVPLPFTSVEAPELEEYDEDGDGWQSGKGSKYPVTLTFKLNGDTNSTSIIESIELLAHESKTPNKVDIDLGILSHNASSWEECDSVHHLGYVVFNEGDGQSRELKTIPIVREADVLRLTIHGCHSNPTQNPHNQVGIAAIRVLGQKAKAIIQAHTQEARQASTNSLPLVIKNELDPKIAASVDRLERLKKECAAAEDFDMAAKIKQGLGKVFSLLIAFKESENQMKQAALDEEYVQASRLKAERDERREAAKTALAEVEKQFAGDGIITEKAANLSISTIKDQSFMSERSLHSTREEQEKSYNTYEEESTNASVDREEVPNGNDSSSRSVDTADHPLAGVDGAEELPSPDDIERDISTDLAHKVESLFGNYRAKCFFSKNWSLREASLAKMTLMMSEICSAGTTEDVDVAEIIFTIVEQANADKNVQVNLSGLILLDEALLQLESNRAPINMTPQLSRILVDLFSKMADNSKKVAESAEISLLSLAHSSSVDVSYVTLLATKRVRSKEAKGGRTVRARLQFLANLSAEFGADVIWKKSIEFAKLSKAFDHRDGSVRDASKALVLILAKIHGDEVFESLKGELAERQLRELRYHFDAY